MDSFELALWSSNLWNWTRITTGASHSTDQAIVAQGIQLSENLMNYLWILSNLMTTLRNSNYIITKSDFLITSREQTPNNLDIVGGWREPKIKRNIIYRIIIPNQKIATDIWNTTIMNIFRNIACKRPCHNIIYTAFFTLNWYATKSH